MVMIANSVNILKTTKSYDVNQCVFILYELYLNKPVFKKSIRDQEGSVSIRYRQLWPQNQSCFHAATGPATAGCILPLPPVGMLSVFVDGMRPILLACLCQSLQPHALSGII